MTDPDHLISVLNSTAGHFNAKGDAFLSKLLYDAKDAIVSLRASLANAERRAEDAEARNVFLETEFLALAEKVKK
jgi:hypothetical protein